MARSAQMIARLADNVHCHYHKENSAYSIGMCNLNPISQ